MGVLVVTRTATLVKPTITPPKPKEQTMKKQRITFAVSLTYLWALMILLGAILFDTLVLYPNIFHDVPRSLDTAMGFMVVRGPGDFFPSLGFLSWLTGIGALILSWRVKSARYWILGSLIVMVCQGLVSMAFFWPRNTIMFEEGTAVHSVAYLQQTAQEFQTGHWLRVALNAAASALSFVGFLKLYRHRIKSEDLIIRRRQP
ncbi:MAG: hypothetical protein M3N18_11295 [Actinomycetota bacterium]|nr:hypothetical protein [Actinomycetota bacterium]